jgi:hypothetical protein
MVQAANSIPTERIARSIVVVRDHKVMLDSDLAKLYGVTTKRLNEQVRRNRDRFPADFMFQLEAEEADALRSHFATLETGRGRHRKYAPYVFTEQGVAMLSSVLKSKRAVHVNIAIMRAFVQLRQVMASNAALARKVADMEHKYDGQFQVIFEALRQLMAPPPTPPKRKIGFVAD